MTKTNTSKRIERAGHLRWVTVSDLVINERAQRDLRPGWAAQIAAEFDPDRFQPPLVSARDGQFFVIDGQHRIEALRVLGWDDQLVQCWVYENKSEAEEADLFLWHNNRKTVTAFDKFQIGVVAERPDEQDINRIVLASGLRVSHADTGIRAVGALRKVYSHGPKVLARTLRIVRDSYGDDGLDGHIIEGIGLLCARYNGELNEDTAISRLSTARGGIGALNSKSYATRKMIGKPLPQCVAAAAVEIINSGRGGKKLPGWWS
jgi:hypothetical protein